MNHLEKVGAMLCNKRLQLGILELHQSISRKVIYRAIVMQSVCLLQGYYTCVNVQNGMLTCVRFYSSVCGRMLVRKCKIYI
jgi:hypothetical protein